MSLSACLEPYTLYSNVKLMFKGITHTQIMYDAPVICESLEGATEHAMRECLCSRTRSLQGKAKTVMQLTIPTLLGERSEPHMGDTSGIFHILLLLSYVCRGLCDSFFFFFGVHCAQYNTVLFRCARPTHALHASSNTIFSSAFLLKCTESALQACTIQVSNLSLDITQIEQAHSIQ